MIRRPTTEQLDTAIAWLRSNEGDDGEATRCGAVADWLEAFEQEALLRSEARKAGVTVSRLKRALQDRVKGEIA